MKSVKMQDFQLALTKAIIHGVEVAVAGLIFVVIWHTFSKDAEVLGAFKDLLIAALGIGATTVLPALIRKWLGMDYVNDR